MSSSDLAKASELGRYLSRDAKLLSSCASSAAVTKSALSIEQAATLDTVNQSKLNFLHRMSDEAAEKYAMSLIEFSNAEESKKKQFEKAAVYSYLIDLSIEEAYVKALNEQMSTREELEALEEQLENEKQHEGSVTDVSDFEREEKKGKSDAEKELEYLREMDKLRERTIAELEENGALYKLKMEHHSNVYSESLEKEVRSELGSEATESDVDALMAQRKADTYDDLELINQAKKLSMGQDDQLFPANRPIPSAPPLEKLDSDDKENLSPENRPIPSAPLEDLDRDDQANLEAKVQQYTADGVPIAQLVEDTNPENVPVYTPDGKPLVADIAPVPAQLVDSVQEAAHSILDRLSNVVKEFMNSPAEGEEGWSRERDNELLDQSEALLNEHRQTRGVDPMSQSSSDYVRSTMYADRDFLHSNANIINRYGQEEQEITDRSLRGMNPNGEHARNVRQHQQRSQETLYGDLAQRQERNQETQASTSTTPGSTKLTPSDVSRQGSKLKEEQQQREQEAADKKSSSDQGSSSPSSAPTPKP